MQCADGLDCRAVLAEVANDSAVPLIQPHVDEGWHLVPVVEALRGRGFCGARSGQSRKGLHAEILALELVPSAVSEKVPGEACQDALRCSVDGS